MMEGGETAPDVLRALLAIDPARDRRQLGIVDSRGNSDAWTGSSCVPWCGHSVGEGFSAQGNMLVGPETISAMVASFASTASLDLAERLLTALEAADRAGGDKRGRQCAAIYVVDLMEYPLWDLRVEDHVKPVAELRRIYEISKLELLPYVEALPTRDNPLGSLSQDFSEMESLPPPMRPGGGGSALTARPDTRPPSG